MKKVNGSKRTGIYKQGNAVDLLCTNRRHTHHNGILWFTNFIGSLKPGQGTYTLSTFCYKKNSFSKNGSVFIIAFTLNHVNYEDESKPAVESNADISVPASRALFNGFFSNLFSSFCILGDSVGISIIAGSYRGYISAVLLSFT